MGTRAVHTANTEDRDRSFGVWLRHQREAQDFTRERLALVIGCSTDTIKKLETHKRRPSRELLARVFRFLNVSTHDQAALTELARKRTSPAETRTHASDTLVPLPVPMTPLIGRNRERATIRKTLTAGEDRLIALIGSPGVGKTRLALHLATDTRAHFIDGVVYVPLEHQTTLPQALTLIAQHCAIPADTEAHQGAHLRRALTGRRLLLVLDNLEHITDIFPALVDLVRETSDLVVLTTSRVAPRVQDVCAIRVMPLGLPGTDAPSVRDLYKADATHLFVQRMIAVVPDWTPTPADGAVIAQICRRLDGLPLAIELAAARGTLLPPTAIAHWLDHHLDVVGGGASDLPERHQTLRALMQWSYTLLAPPVQRLLCWCALFPAGASLDMLATLVDPPVLDHATTLLEASLAVRDTRDPEFPRLTLLETVRAYAMEQLTILPDQAEVRRAFTDTMFTRAIHLGATLHTVGQETAFRRLHYELPNLRAAMHYALERELFADIVSLLHKTVRFWETHHPSEGQHRVKIVLAHATALTPAMHGDLALVAGRLAYIQADYQAAHMYTATNLSIQRTSGDIVQMAIAVINSGRSMAGQRRFAEAQALYEEGIVLLHGSDQYQILGMAHNNLANIFLVQEQYGRAETLTLHALHLLESVNDTHGIAITLGTLGHIAYYQDNYVLAEAYYQQGLDYAEQVGDRLGIALFWWDLGRTALHLGRIDDAYRLLSQSLCIHDQEQHIEGMIEGLEAFAELAITTGIPEHAALLVGAAEQQRYHHQLQREPYDIRRWNIVSADLQKQLGMTTYGAARTRSSGWLLKQSVAFALATPTRALPHR